MSTRPNSFIHVIASATATKHQRIQFISSGADHDVLSHVISVLSSHRYNTQLQVTQRNPITKSGQSWFHSVCLLLFVVNYHKMSVHSIKCIHPHVSRNQYRSSCSHGKNRNLLQTDTDFRRPSKTHIRVSHDCKKNTLIRAVMDPTNNLHIITICPVVFCHRPTIEIWTEDINHTAPSRLQ